MRRKNERVPIREQARRLSFGDWASGDLAQLEADVRASCVLRLSRELRDAAEGSNYAGVLSRARRLLRSLADGRARPGNGDMRPGTVPPAARCGVAPRTGGVLALGAVEGKAHG